MARVIPSTKVGLPNARDPDWYIPEGNIVLALGCGTDGDGVLFRVLKSQLVKQSTVFEDMFSLPQPPEEHAEGDVEMYDDCQVLRLDDSIFDLRSTFDLIWNIPPTEPSPQTLLGILRASTKYAFLNARKWSIFQLEKLFPPKSTELYNPSHFWSLRQNQAAIELVIASNACDTPQFLPYAFYSLATEDWETMKQMKEVGLLRLDGVQLAMLGAGRAYLQRQLGDMLIQALPGMRRPFEFNNVFGGPPDCVYKQPRTTDDELEHFVSKADPILWIKTDKGELVEDDWEFCALCKQGWINQADKLIREFFCGFCSSMELSESTGWKELHEK
ncbi:hypothetical protein FRB96_001382 [Tulasnella sp. 330]|nr:hypothetical protein FRB96_001382 [Tulasnella sp. 330]KAG8888985.1 hypothetical protein FRB98_006249 [Tulasnella sp. 332]